MARDKSTGKGESKPAAAEADPSALPTPSDTVVLSDLSEAFPPALADSDADTMVLELEDLLPDASGEVVLFASQDIPVNISTREMLTEIGIADHHVTAGGVDVTGLHYYVFESGITVYSPTDLLIVGQHAADES